MPSSRTATAIRSMGRAGGRPGEVDDGRVSACSASGGCVWEDAMSVVTSARCSVVLTKGYRFPVKDLSERSGEGSFRQCACATAGFAVFFVSGLASSAQCGPRRREIVGRHPQRGQVCRDGIAADGGLSLIHISEPTRQEAISYAVFCLKTVSYTHLTLPTNREV